MADQKSGNLLGILGQFLPLECCSALPCIESFFQSLFENNEPPPQEPKASNPPAPNPPAQGSLAPQLEAQEPQAPPLKALIEFLEIENQKIEEDKEKQKAEIEKQKAEILKKCIAEAEIDVFISLCNFSINEENKIEKINLLYASAIFKAKIKNKDQEAMNFLKELRPDQNIHINYTEILRQNINEAKSKSFLKEVFEGREPKDEYRDIDEKTLESILSPQLTIKQQLRHLKDLADKMQKVNPNPIIKKWQNILKEDEAKVGREIDKFYQNQAQYQKVDQNLEEAFSNYYEENKSDDCSFVFGEMDIDSREKIGKNFLKLKFFSTNFPSKHKIEEAKNELITLLNRDKSNNDFIKDLNSGNVEGFIKKVEEQMRSHKEKEEKSPTYDGNKTRPEIKGVKDLEEIAKSFALKFKKKTASENTELRLKRLKSEKIKKAKLTNEKIELEKKIEEESKLPKSILLRINSAMSLLFCGKEK